ncbi:MAG TPA: septal ring lytic transglycosylase RlpA family protein [Allosphingosinicella sp.]|jgi:rare lipoprotein A|uniref:septal ring lytic transglycosylase RlpA family protein n=1 Tax=Allosphingosinicella sp. TaxID=2823234 RepID=UPI002F28E2D3
MSGSARTGSGRFKRLRALKRLRVQRRHLKRALLATTPGIALLSGGSIPVAKLAVPIAMSATVIPIDSQARAAISQQAAPSPTPPGAVIAEAVEASYYGDGFAGRPTASGEIFDPALLTAAHRTLPLGSLVRVTEVSSGRTVVVRINDRGPFHGDRAIDLSTAAAHQIGLLERGTGNVTLHLIGDV